MPFSFLLPRGCPYRFLRPPIHASVRYVSKQQSGHGWDFCKLEAVFSHSENLVIGMIKKKKDAEKAYSLHIICEVPLRLKMK